MTAQFLNLLIAFHSLHLTNDEIFQYFLLFMVTRSNAGPDHQSPSKKTKRKGRKK